MDTDDVSKTDVKKSSVVSTKLKSVIGGAAIAACAVLAGFVFTQYEAGIPPAEAAQTSARIAKSAKGQFIHVTVAEQNPALHGRSVPGASRLAVPVKKIPMAAGGMCSVDGPMTS
jgi:hypothetical protein